MTRLPKSPLSKPLPLQSAMASTPFRGERWSQVLTIACHLAEYRGELQPAIAERDMATLRASLAAHASRTTVGAEDAAIAAAIALVTRMPWLFAPWLLPAWRRVAGLLARVDRRKARIGAAILATLAVVSVGIYLTRSHSYAHWRETVAPVAGEASSLQQKAGIAIRLATRVGIVPLGASVHAEGALIEINKLNSTMRGLIVTSTDPIVLQSAFAQYPDAQQVVAHDRGLLRLARNHLQLARDALDRADKVLSYGKKWHDLNPYAVLADGLSPQWSSEAAAMRAALGSGDLQNIEQADRRLEIIGKEGEIARSAESIVGSLPAGDRAIAAPYLAIIEDAIAQGELDRARPALATLTMMQKQAPLSYSLYLLSIPGEKAFVVKQDARDASAKHYYLIVQATNEHGAQVPVDIHDSELGKDMVVRRFGIEVSAETFGQAQSDERDSLLLVGRKSPGTVGTAFALPVLDGRISRW